MLVTGVSKIHNNQGLRVRKHKGKPKVWRVYAYENGKLKCFRIQWWQVSYWKRKAAETISKNCRSCHRQFFFNKREKPYICPLCNHAIDMQESDVIKWHEGIESKGDPGVPQEEDTLSEDESEEAVEDFPDD